jgi:uncharacterized phiE125 gp8 family phage protein
MLTAEPIAPGVAARDEAKAYLRIAGTDEDATIDRLLRAAAELCEQFTGRVLLRRGFVETLAAAPTWRRLARAPVTAITSVEGVGGDGAAVPLAADAYAVDIDAEGDGWVRILAPGTATLVRIGYQAGLAADWTSTPDTLRVGALQLAAYLYAQRGGPEQPPAAVVALWRPWRRMRLG